MIEMDGVRGAIKEFIERELVAGARRQPISDTTPLMSTRLIDSRAMLELVEFLQVRFGVELEAHEAQVDNFETVALIAELVHRKLAP